MTKYSKITKSTFAIIALSLILVAVLAFGGTYAYFTATATGTGSVTMGTMKLAGEGVVTLNLETDPVVPGQSITNGQPIKIAASNDTNVPMQMLAYIKVEAEAGTTITTVGSVDSTWEAVTGHTGYYAYKGTGYKTAGTADEEFTIFSDIIIDRGNGNTIMGKKLNVEVTVWALQADWVNAENGKPSTLTSATDVYNNITSYYTVGGATATFPGVGA